MNAIPSVNLNSETNRVLFVPDSIWGDLSGHRSSKYLVKCFFDSGAKVGVYAPKKNHTIEQQKKLGKSIEYFEKTDYTFTQNFFSRKVRKEFVHVLKTFNPDIVFYMGTIKNKLTMNICSKLGVKYSYLPLTTEYYCVKDFAGLENGPCNQCMNSPILSPFRNKCLGSISNIIIYIKEIFLSLISKKRFFNANKIIGYSKNQFLNFKKYGAKEENFLKMPIFFDPETVEGVEITSGDYFVMAGQKITAKGWHLLPQIIKKSSNIKYKLIMQDEKKALEFINKNGLLEYYNLGLIDVITYLENHTDFIKLIARSKGVLVPSYYDTTGEFYLLESLGLGKPVVLFNVGIHSEIIKHKVNGMISNVGDLDTFHENIQQINEDVFLRNKLSKGAKDLYAELTSIGEFIDSLPKYFL